MRKLPTIYCLVLVTVSLSACGLSEYRTSIREAGFERRVRNYSTHYMPYIDLSQANNILEKDVTYNSCRAIPVDDIDITSKNYAENGYLLVGDVIIINDRYRIDVAQAHCGTLGAEIALYENIITSSKEITTQINIPYVSYASTTYQGNIGNFIGSSSTTFTQYVPHYTTKTINTHRMWASYFIKAKPPILGAYYEKLSDNARYEAETNSGAYVYLVINNSPAFKSNVIIGDIITKVDNDIVVFPEDLTSILHKNAGQNVVLSIVRKGKPIEIPLTLNPK